MASEPTDAGHTLGDGGGLLMSKQGVTTPLNEVGGGEPTETAEPRPEPEMEVLTGQVDVVPPLMDPEDRNRLRTEMQNRLLGVISPEAQITGAPEAEPEPAPEPEPEPEPAPEPEPEPAPEPVDVTAPAPDQPAIAADRPQPQGGARSAPLHAGWDV